MRPPKILFYLALPILVLTPALWAATYEPAVVSPPKPQREFRGAWVATVKNIDWPSEPGLTTAEQKAELLAILDRAERLKLNAIIFQVRPACDALYASKLEPWSEFLTGTMGKPPEPFYDPLALAVQEAHKRGLELHAWFNPYRARVKSERSPVAATHVSKTRPQIVRDYGKYLWLDPGEKETQDHSLSVVLDVVKRYDVDGVHFDDYFYPYVEHGPGGKDMDFPDDASWKKYGGKSGLTRGDWRRENVNLFVQRVYRSIKATKPWVKFGVSPFGIWRPGYPPQIKGFDAYAVLYADSKKWLQAGWLDYFTPQLYWAIEPKEQSFRALLDWWDQQNLKRRHVWPGMSTTKVRTWGADEIVSQIRLASRQPVSAGHVHWNMKSLQRATDLAAALEHGPYAETALVPACPWLGRRSPSKPSVFLSGLETGNLRIAAEPRSGETVRQWVLQTEADGKWKTEVLPGGLLRRDIEALQPAIIAITPIDRNGNAGPTVAYRKKQPRQSG